MVRLQAEVYALPKPINQEQLEKLEDKMFDIDNEILQAQYMLGTKVKEPFNHKEKGKWWQNEKAYGDRVTNHTLNHQMVLTIIIGQCAE